MEVGKHVTFGHRIEAVAQKDLDEVRRACEHVIAEVEHAIRAGAHSVGFRIEAEVHHAAAPTADKPATEAEPTPAPTDTATA